MEYNINSFFEGYDRAVRISKKMSSDEFYSTERHEMKPTKRLYGLIEHLGFKSKESQEEIIDQIISKSHYAHFMYKGEQTIHDNPKRIIEGLIGDFELRRDKKLKDQIKTKTTLAATDIADYIFCPASFSLKQSFDVPKTFEMEAGEELHDKRKLDEFLSNLLNKRKRDNFRLSLLRQIKEGVDIRKTRGVSFQDLAEDRGIRGFLTDGNKIDLYRFYKNKEVDDSEFDEEELKEIYKGMYGDLLTSKCVFYGHNNKETEPFFSKDGKFAGMPDYIFEREDGSKFIVEEKHTWKEEVLKPWESHKMQVQSYLNTVIHDDIPMSNGYLIYFSWHYYKGKLSTKNPRLHKINKTSALRQALMKTHAEILDFMHSGEKKFDNNSINTNKCYKCSSRIYCNNMGGQQDDIRFPYSG